ncbi:EAL domain-containing protein [Jatrophihabitans telluris]|uniref:EAL domain-containing protein n=1 Tax=Jatrophihabitans telluris TaxID=2038343 RepID=A0ABY4R584_9ACTN|nr:EAL domain-containing protein [Jatrophihabitans telluris]UQX90343.1 EAL domain-containing protein [Jatrophihabitans telluris]
MERVVVAGDSTVLVVNDRLVDPALPLEPELAEHPLTMAALSALTAARPGTAPDSTGAERAVHIRLVIDPDTGATRGAEARYVPADGQPSSTAVLDLVLSPWCYPEELRNAREPDLHTAEIMAGPYASILLPELPAFLEGLTELFALRRACRDFRIVRHGTGEIRLVRFYGWFDEPGEDAIPHGVAIDITDLHVEPSPQKRYFDAIVDVMPDSILLIQLSDGQILWANRRVFERLNGAGHSGSRSARYADLRLILHPTDRRQLDVLAEELRDNPAGGARQTRMRMRDEFGNWRWIQVWVAPWQSGPDGRTMQILCTLRDVDAQVRAEQRMAWEAGHDPLTGLANRRVIGETLQSAADDPADPRRNVYFIDLDDFKKVNDAYGHSAGDDLLRTLAARISVLVTASDVVGRFGGDELVIVSSMPPDQLAERLLAAIRRPVTVAGAELTVTTSIGTAKVGAEEDPGDVVRRSNEAMYSAKRGGGNRYVVAGPLNTGPAQRRVEVEAELRRALRAGTAELRMAFQPIVESDRVPVAAEALLRWHHPSRGTLLPSEFLDIAEGAGLMDELSESIVRQSLSAVASWNATGRRLMVAVNAGRRELGTGRLFNLISETIAEFAVSPQQVCLEVTESVLVDAGSPELAELWRLRDLGLEVALDDFGTGYAPLTYLKRLPATIVKLDKSFVAGLGLPVPNPVDLAVSRAVVQLADELGMRVIAEGVESERQMITLMSIGYRYFQGFWAYQPMPTEELHAILLADDPAGLR